MRRRPTAPLVAAMLALAFLPALALAQAAAEPAKPAAAPAKPPLAAIYGTLNVNFQLTAAPGATNPAQSVRPRNSVSVDSSNIGVRAALPVNEWVGGTAQCETSANVDGINVQGICNRNSRVGLTGPWGTLFYGNWDTPFKAAAYGTKADDPFMNTDVFGYQSIMGSPGFGYRSGGWSTVSDSRIKGFDVRANNSVAYHSPSFYGLSAKVQYSADEFKNVKGTQNPELFGGVVNWDYAVTPEIAVTLLAAYEQHNDGFALVGINGAVGAAFGSTGANTAGTAAVANSSTDSAWRVGAGIQLTSPAGATTVGGMFDQLTLEQKHAAAGAVTKYQRGAWQVALKHRYQDFELRLRYSQAAKGSVTLNGGGGSTDDYGASMLVGGLAYYFAPTLQTYVHVGQIKNDASAQYTFTIGGSPTVADPPPKGADLWAGLVGIRYAF